MKPTQFLAALRRMLPMTALLLVAAGGEAAPTAEFACPQPGTRFTMVWASSDMRQPPRRPLHLTIGERDGFDCHVLGGRGIDYWIHAGFVEDDQPVEWRAMAESLWPLKVGNKIHASTRYDGDVWMMDYEVAGFEKITSPIGTLDTYKVIEMLRVNGSLSWTATLWWSPDLSFTVSFQRVGVDRKVNQAWQITALGDRGS